MNKKSAFAALLFMFSLAAPAVQAAPSDISKPDAVLTLDDDFATLGATFSQSQKNDWFSNHFTFTLGEVSDIAMVLTSTAVNQHTGLDITAFDLFRVNNPIPVAIGSGNSGATDLWTVQASDLAAGAYYLQVVGKVVASGGGTFSADGTISRAVSLPVPEPSGYAMLLAGLAIVGFTAYRRRPELFTA